MKSAEKQRALSLRAQGLSYNDILKEVGVSKSTISLWLRDIPLSDNQIANLANKFRAGREKFSRSMHSTRDARWAAYHREAENEYAVLSQDPQFMFGLALYIGEGSKTKQNDLCLTNCDPRVIQKAIAFFLSIGVPYSSLRCGLHLHPGLCVEAAEYHWRNIAGLPASQFHKTTPFISRASAGKKGNLQMFGTCQLYASHTKTRQKLSQRMLLSLMARSFIG